MIKITQKVTLLVGFLIALLIVTGFIWFNRDYSGQKELEIIQPVIEEAIKDDDEPVEKQNADPTSIWVVINKQNSISKSYVPSDLTVPNVPLNAGSGAQYMKVSGVVVRDFERLFNGAKKQGITLVLSSGYRSATLQASLYNGYVASDGQALADTYSARPGHSEHQTGLATDVHSLGEGCRIEQCWANTSGGKWVAKNAYKYGFIIRYPKNKQNIVGYTYKPGHLRYVGESTAKKIYEQDTTLEEYFGFDPAPTY